MTQIVCRKPGDKAEFPTNRGPFAEFSTLLSRFLDANGVFMTEFKASFIAVSLGKWEQVVGQALLCQKITIMMS